MRKPYDPKIPSPHRRERVKWEKQGDIRCFKREEIRHKSGLEVSASEPFFKNISHRIDFSSVCK